MPHDSVLKALLDTNLKCTSFPCVPPAVVWREARIKSDDLANPLSELVAL